MFAKNKENIIAVLDIGSHKICCLIAEKNKDGTIHILGKGHQFSEGVSRGSITDIEAAEAAILATIDEAEQQAQQKIEEVVVNLSCHSIKSYSYSYDIHLPGRRITKKDLKQWLALEYFQEEIPENYKLLQAFPTSYYLDGEPLHQPENLHGNLLRVDMLLTTVLETAVKNMAAVLHRSDLQVENFVPSSMASSLSCLSEDEMEIGAIVLDMGAGGISIAIWERSQLIYSSESQGGGIEITENIAKAFTTSFENAERIKTLYGSTFLSDNEALEFLDVEQMGEIHSTAEFSKKELNQIICETLAGQLKEVQNHLNAVSNSAQIRRIVLTGGSSEFLGIAEFIGEKLNRAGSVRLGRPYLQGDHYVINSPIWSTVIGLLEYVLQENYQLMKEYTAEISQDGLWKRMFQWFRLLF